MVNRALFPGLELCGAQESSRDSNINSRELECVFKTSTRILCSIKNGNTGAAWIMEVRAPSRRKCMRMRLIKATCALILRKFEPFGWLSTLVIGVAF
jgi:hypothetical protein